jgi:riboflavin biosynthesis pyrimidine reductase
MRCLFPPAPGELTDSDLERLYALPAGGHLANLHVRANMVASVDGAVELSGRAQGLSGTMDMHLFSLLRSLTDVVLAGAGTVRAENYGPAHLPEASRRARRDRNQLPLPPIAVITGSADLDPQARLFATPTDQSGAPLPIVLTCRRAPLDRREALAAVAQVVICGEDQVSLPEALAQLQKLGHRAVLCEGGPSLLHQLLDEGLLDELCLTSAPLLAGGGHLTLGAGAFGGGPIALKLIHVLHDQGTLFGRYGIT